MTNSYTLNTGLVGQVNIIGKRFDVGTRMSDNHDPQNEVRCRFWHAGRFPGVPVWCVLSVSIVAVFMQLGGVSIQFNGMLLYSVRVCMQGTYLHTFYNACTGTGVFH